MKKWVMGLLTVILLFGVGLWGQSVSAVTSFKDLASNYWAFNEIDFLVNEGIIAGYPDGTFKPDQTITNAQGAILLVRALGLQTNETEQINFSDVGKTHYAYKEIVAAVTAGIFPKTKTFQPDEPMTRESTSLAIANAFKFEGSGKVQFSDVKVDRESYTAISALVKNDIVQGFPDRSFRPNDSVTRAQFSTFIARALSSDFLPTQYNIPFNMNPVYIMFKFAMENPEGAQDLFLPNSGFDLKEFSKNVEAFEVTDVKEIGRLNGQTEFSVTFDAKLNEKYEGPLAEKDNHLYFLIIRHGFMDYKVISVGTAPHLTGDDSLSFTNQHALTLFKEAKNAFYHVVSGGQGERDQTTFTHNGFDYRYFAESLNSMEKLQTYLSQFYTPDRVNEFIKVLGIIEHKGKLAQPNADGGSLLYWEKASIKLLNQTTSERKYEMFVPLGETSDIEPVQGELHFVPGVGWRVHALN